jgi:plastocyanin
VRRSLILVPIVTLAVAPLASAPPRANGAIAGRVEIAQKVLPPARRPNVNDLGMPSHRDVPDRRRSVVYLETAPRGAFEVREGGRARMDQRNESFVPHVLAITVGTTVDFPNNDQTFHNVFSLSKTRPFDLGRYASGRSKAVRFDQPGIVRVFCDIHSHMSAFILVFAHRFFAVTTEEGRYRIDDVPPGTYTVVVWNELLPPASRVIAMQAGGEPVELNFSLGQPGE